ncbi:hypothetical protein EYF80_039225 [Liparis tanakae]|uniref:Uncharacterized protein n=1 Tax=Liparis tanakae TaxID=230148 RepID=A0A4Z2GBW5_9TELE|nr:hypothetical protein EYF80_039225 [Liparis tanakae]
MAKKSMIREVPDDHEASAVADHHLVGIHRVLLQGLYVFQVPPADVVVRHAGGDEERMSAVGRGASRGRGRASSGHGSRCLPEARDLHDEDVSSFGAQQQQLPRGVSQHGGHPGHTGGGTEEEERRRRRRRRRRGA